MTKKTIKDLKVGDSLYFLDTDHYFVTVNKVTEIEDFPGDYDDKYLKITWEETGFSRLPNYCVVKEEDTAFWEEPDYDSEDDYDDDEMEELEDEERHVFLNREDVISQVEQQISKLQNEIKDLL